MGFLEKDIAGIKPVMDILGINTDTENMPGIKAAQAYYIALARKMGFEARLCGIDKNGNPRVIEIRPKGTKFSEQSKLGLVVHLDTVPIGEGWTHDPYGEVDETGRVYGRGVVDDKAPAVETLQTMFLLKDHVSPDWVIICGSSEETEWVDMEAYMSEKRARGEELPEFSVTIDGDGVQNGCRGYLDLRLRFPRKGASQLITQFGTPEGAANNSVPGFATAVVDGKRVEAIGQACHSSIPQNGVNAIILLAEKIREENPEAYEEYKDFFRLMEIMGKSEEDLQPGTGRSFDSSKTLFFQEKPSVMNGQDVGYTSSCPTTCEIQGDEIVVNLNIRLMAGTTKEEVDEAIRRICEEYHCKAEIEEFHLPAFIPMDNPSIGRLLEAYQEELGMATESRIAGGVGYNAALPRCAIFGPRWAVDHDEEDTCHAADETRTIKDIVIFMNMLARFVKKEIPLPELEQLNEILIRMQTDEKARELIKTHSKEYSPREMNMMTEMLVNPKYRPPDGELKDETTVIDAMRMFREGGLFSSLTPEQLSFIVNETLVSYKLSGTKLTIEQFTKVSPIIFLMLARYNDEESLAKGLLTNDQLKDKAFLGYIRDKGMTSERLEEISSKLKSVHAPIVTEDEYGRLDE